MTTPNPAPTLTSVAPASVVAGNAAFTLTVAGTGFVTGSVVQVDGSNRTTNYGLGDERDGDDSRERRGECWDAHYYGLLPDAGGWDVERSDPDGDRAPERGADADEYQPDERRWGKCSLYAGGGGHGLRERSVVQVDGSTRTTTYGSATQLTALILASDVASAGTHTITVFSPTPGGGTSTGATLTVTAPNPAPTLTSVAPASVVAGNAAFTLTVAGTGFVTGSVVQVDGSNRTTTYGSATQLTATIPASDVVSAGTHTITVFSPTPGGGTSSGATLTVTAPPNVVPTLTSISPTSVVGGSAAFTLAVGGTGFVNGSVVQVDGSTRTTTFGSATQLTATILASDVVSAGTHTITVFSPTPGGGTSTGATLTVTAPNPAPTLTSVAPASVVAGNAAFTLTVAGTGFVTGSVVQVDGSNRTTTYGSATQLTATIPASDVVSARTHTITVFSPTPGVGRRAERP